MPYTPKSNNEMRKDYSGTIDTIVGFTIECPNQQLTQVLTPSQQIELPRPYRIHDLKKNKVYEYGKDEMKELNLSNLISAEELPPTIFIEFLNDKISAYTRTKDFHQTVKEILDGLQIKIFGEEYSLKTSIISKPASYKDLKSNIYSKYLFFTINNNPKYLIYPNIQEIERK